jgi:methionyl-tRNA formyltransferase
MLSVGREPIRSDDTTLSLGERMSMLGAQLLIDTLPGYLNGSIKPQAQPSDGVTYSPKINKADAQIDWTRSAIDLDRAVRAYIPWPGAFTSWNGQMVKILKAGCRKQEAGSRPGEVVKLADGAIGVVTGDGVIELIEIQLAGRKAMSARDFVRGQPDFINAQLTMHNAQL